MTEMISSLWMTSMTNRANLAERRYEFRPCHIRWLNYVTEKSAASEACLTMPTPEIGEA
jgi:hypothetical protein